MASTRLTLNEAALGGGFTHVLDVDYVDLIAAGNGGQINLAMIPAGGAVEMCTVHKVTAAAGSTSVVFDVGTTLADPDEYIDALDADAMTTPVSNTGDAFTSGYTKVVTPKTSATQIVLEVNDAAVASLTAGRWLIGLRILDLGRFA